MSDRKYYQGQKYDAILSHYTPKFALGDVIDGPYEDDYGSVFFGQWIVVASGISMEPSTDDLIHRSYLRKLE